jgi:hypothetical protein
LALPSNMLTFYMIYIYLDCPTLECSLSHPCTGFMR